MPSGMPRIGGAWTTTSWATNSDSRSNSPLFQIAVEVRPDERLVVLDRHTWLLLPEASTTSDQVLPNESMAASAAGGRHVRRR